MEIYSPKNKSKELFKLNQFKDKETKPGIHIKVEEKAKTYTVKAEKAVYFKEGSGYVDRENLLVKIRRVFYEKLYAIFEQDEVV